jgi:hypothetical protein
MTFMLSFEKGMTLWDFAGKNQRRQGCVNIKPGDQVGMKEGLDCTDNSKIPNQENIAFIIVHGNYCFWSQLGG